MAMPATMEAGVSPFFSGSYASDDVTILLKPTEIATVATDEKERLIQSGAKHYSEMLSAEKLPDDRYMALYREALSRNAGRLRGDIATLGRAIAARPSTARECVIVSLARAGTPIGVLLKRALSRLDVTTHHYSISIIRDRGIDRNALRFIKARHGTGSTVFVDGWTGKGAIKTELRRSVAEADLGFSPFLAVIADPAGCADLAATTEDYLIPSGLLNGIVSGLISRSVLRDDLVGPDDFHACLYQIEHAEHDLTQQFLRDVEEAAPPEMNAPPWSPERSAEARLCSRALIEQLKRDFGIGDVNRIKPGIAEATRAVLRRVPELLLVRDRRDPEIQHLLHLASTSGVPVNEYDLHAYRAVTVIKSLGGSQE
ncbi:MAG: cysteine protease StiP family protein [Sphingomonas sp.]